MRSSNYHYEERQPRDERAQLNRSTPREGESYGGGGPRYGSRYDYQYSGGGKPPTSPTSARSGFPSRYAPQGPHSRTPRHLKNVVTNSFSVEDEREDARGHSGRRMYRDNRFPTIERRNDVGDREDSGRSEREESYYHTEYLEGSHGKGPSTHHRTASLDRPPSIQRSLSASSSKYKGSEGNMKRSYYHHSNSNEGSALPPDFIPPKRIKTTSSPRGEAYYSQRSAGSDRPPPEWFNRIPTWESEEEHFNRVPRVQSFPPQQQWKKQQSPSQASQMSYRHEGQSKQELPHVSPASESDPSAMSWRSSSSSREWSAHSSRQGGPGGAGYRYWESSHESERSKHEGHRAHPNYHSGLREKLRDPYSTPRRPPYHSAHLPHEPHGSGKGLEMEERKMHSTKPSSSHDMETEPAVTQKRNSEDIVLLALPQDKVALSETLCVVIENIEVFTATQEDVDAPAPGRKHAVVVGQIGLRCIHCRHTTKCTDRVKRAVCYPSSIKRIYRTVIDMKLDHFSQCKYVPDQLKHRLHQLKAVQTRSTGTTMQYFIRAAHALGMQDAKSGVRLRPGIQHPLTAASVSKEEKPTPAPAATSTDTTPIHRSDSSSGNTATTSLTSKRTDSMMSTETIESGGAPENVVSLDNYYEGRAPLSLPEDETSLSPLRCFLRKQVCAFSATDEDIAVRAPTTFSITVGQVGIGCIHCVKQPAKHRSNRAVCFPFSIGRIYQSVADIQRFHFTECKMLPPDVKAKFLELQKASSKGSKGLATRQYWVTSAKKIGLVDTQNGIRFGRDPSKPEEASAFSLDILAQAAFTVTTANKQLVVPEDKNTIAEFLYVVMEQLQPCRFTEADRNKRRLKDVGCIGVECKHCAGKVDGRKFFWSSVNAVESNFVSVHTHMLECQSVPQSLKDHLIELKKLRKQQTAALKTGSQKAFFARVWERLHEEEANANAVDAQSAGMAPQSQLSGPSMLSALVGHQSHFGHHMRPAVSQLDRQAPAQPQFHLPLRPQRGMRREYPEPMDSSAVEPKKQESRKEDGQTEPMSSATSTENTTMVSV